MMTIQLTIEDNGSDGTTLKKDGKIVARGRLTVQEEIGENIPAGTWIEFPVKFVGHAVNEAEKTERWR